MADLKRRSLLRIAGGILTAAVSSPLTNGCTRPASSGLRVPRILSADSSGISSGRVTLPAYVPLSNLPAPDLPGTHDGLVAPGYLRYPTNLIKSVQTAPGKGGYVNVLTPSLRPSPTPLDRNLAWQHINHELGLSLNIPTISSADFINRLETTVSGSDLPDLITVANTAFTLTNLADFLQAACEDLTPHVSGDAIKMYPNLANLPSYAWQSCAFGNRIYTVPLASHGRRATAPILIARSEDLDVAGVTGIGSASELTSVASQLNSPGTRWAFGGSGVLSWLIQVFGGPCIWTESGGSFTKDYETPEYREALAYHRSLWDAGLFHPDSATLSSLSAGVQFHAGKFVFAAYLNWSTFQLAWDLAVTAGQKFTPLPVLPFKYDGRGRAPQFLPTVATAIVALKKAKSDRISELLGVLDYLAAPMGTTEQLLLQYGIEGVDFTRDVNGDVIRTRQGQQDMTVPWNNLVGPPDFLYDSISRDFVPTTHRFQAEHFAATLTNPTVGLYSPTDASKGGALRQTFNDGLNEILFGKRPVRDLDELVKAWRENGGDQIRKEYEQAFQAANM